MKLLFASLLLIPNLVFAQPPQEYKIQVLDENKNVIDSTTFTYPMLIEREKLQHDNQYVNLCLKNKDIVENSYKQAPTIYSLDTREKNDSDSILKLQISLPVFKSISLGDCDIQQPIMQNFLLTTNLPFFLYEQRFKLLDSEGKITNREYTINIQAQKK